MSSLLSGQVALVTGSGKRLGREVACRLASEGADIVVHYHTSETAAHEVVSEIEKLGRRSVALAANLADVGEINQLFRRVADHFGRLNILVNSAANFLAARFGETSQELWDSSLDTNLKAPFFCAQEAAPLLKESAGVIINFADVGGLIGWPGHIPHSVSKAGVIMLTRCLAKALAPKVRVNAVAPGTISMSGDPPEWEADYIQHAPLGRSGRPQDVADAVSFLVHSTFLTGQVLILDGGRSL